MLKKTRKWDLFFMALPGLLFLAAFHYAPLFMGWLIPFKKIDYAKGILGSDWCGFDNFKFYFQSQDAFRTTRNTLVLNFLFIFTTLLLAVILALLLFQLGKKSVKVYQTALFMPYFISWVVASYILYALISPEGGALTQGSSRNLYAAPLAWPWILLGCYLWKNIGYMTLLFYASLLSIDSSLFEAAAIDGATRIQQMTRIAVPHMKPVIIMMALLQIGKIFYADFGMFYFLTKNAGALYGTTDVIDTYVFRALRITGDIGMSSAVGLYQAIVGFLLVLISNLLVKKSNPDYALF